MKIGAVFFIFMLPRPRTGSGTEGRLESVCWKSKWPHLLRPERRVLCYVEVEKREVGGNHMGWFGFLSASTHLPPPVHTHGSRIQTRYHAGWTSVLDSVLCLLFQPPYAGVFLISQEPHSTLTSGPSRLSALLNPPPGALGLSFSVQPLGPSIGLGLPTTPLAPGPLAHCVVHSMGG